MEWLITLGVLVGALALFTLILTLFFFSFAVRRNDKYTVEAALSRMKKKTPPDQFNRVKQGAESFLNAPHKEVFITSRDGLKLCAYVMEQEDPASAQGTIVLVHGWRSHPAFDFSASWSYYLKRVSTSSPSTSAPTEKVRENTYALVSRSDLTSLIG